ncbi:hypothetical protein JTE90_027254 [Oedothorax gibbosus]|uniref:Uncharacterized protein n=1 Tax=Oedothorax gibbosus TaxID=931172 RepID=A0AAV6TNH9_9ARAC|nr:hypothetical protein JTE90_027254 [Oedothorax gibbosus]
MMRRRKRRLMAMDIGQKEEESCFSADEESFGYKLNDAEDSSDNIPSSSEEESDILIYAGQKFKKMLGENDTGTPKYFSHVDGRCEISFDNTTSSKEEAWKTFEQQIVSRFFIYPGKFK